MGSLERAAWAFGGVLVGAVLAWEAATMVLNRYEMRAGADILVWRLDRQTGEIVACRAMGVATEGGTSSPAGAGCWPVSDQIWPRQHR